MKTIFVSVKLVVVAVVALLTFGCASSRSREVHIIGAPGSQVMVPVQKEPSNWRVWSSTPVSRNRVLAPADPIPSDWVPANPVRRSSGSFTYGGIIQSSYSQGTINSSSHFWNDNGPNTQLYQSTWKNGYHYQNPNPVGVYRDYRDFEAAPAQPLQPIQR